MTAYRAYNTSPVRSSLTRIELLLMLFDRAFERLDQAEAALRAENLNESYTPLIKAQHVISGLAGGINPEINPEVAEKTLGLYGFISRELSTPRLEGIANARKILRILQEGFEGIREEAISLEKQGQIVSQEKLKLLLTTA